MAKNYHKRYPDNWKDIAWSVKQSVEWKCSKCGLQCIRLGENTLGLSRSQRMAKTLIVHHQNFVPEDNRLEHLRAVWTRCHLLYYTRRKGNVSAGQLSLF